MRLLWLLVVIGLVVFLLRSVRSTDRETPKRRRDDDEDPPDEDVWAAIDHFK
ncbi:hypothetical protein L6Q96_10035 [Candidatus Binatia bacterium]|nr:hypothetical protein [Candidatus Binatia bacterium]